MSPSISFSSSLESRLIELRSDVVIHRAMHFLSNDAQNSSREARSVIIDLLSVNARSIYFSPTGSISSSLVDLDHIWLATAKSWCAKDSRSCEDAKTDVSRTKKTMDDDSPIKRKKGRNDSERVFLPSSPSSSSSTDCHSKSRPTLDQKVEMLKKQQPAMF